MFMSLPALFTVDLLIVKLLAPSKIDIDTGSARGTTLLAGRSVGWLLRESSFGGSMRRPEEPENFVIAGADGS